MTDDRDRRAAEECPRVKSFMTPCFIRHGWTALDDDRRCVGCGEADIDRCFGRVGGGSSPGLEGRCSRRGVVRADGRMWCKTHAPDGGAPDPAARDIRAAEEWCRAVESRGHLFPAGYPVADLAALLTAARAEGVATAIEAAAREVDACWVCGSRLVEQDAPYCEDVHTMDPLRDDVAPTLAERIRALAPAGLVAVSVDEVRSLLAAYLNAYGCVKAGQVGIDIRRMIVDMGADSTAAIDRIRAAVARKEQP